MSNFGEVLTDTLLVRETIIIIDNFRKGNTAPSDVEIGTTPTIPAFRFANTNELISAYEELPTGYSGGIVGIQFSWSLVSAQSNNDTLDITMDYVAPVAGTTGSGLAKTSTQVTSQVTVTTGEGLAVGDIYRSIFVLDPDDATNPLSSADGVGFEIHLTNTTGVASADLLGASIAYELDV